MELMMEFYVLHTKSIAFPELAIPMIVLTKRHMKKSKNAKLNGALQTLVAKLEANSRYVQERRSQVEFAPEKLGEAESFLKEVEWEGTPLGAYVVSQRRVREERARMLEESMKEEREREGSEEGSEGEVVEEREEREDSEEDSEEEDDE